MTAITTKPYKKLLLAGLVLLLVGCKDLDIETDGDKDEFRFGSAVHLWCTFKDEVVPAGAIAKWTSDRQGVLGTGPDITISNLLPGKHEIEVEVRHGDKKGKKKRKIKIINDTPAVSIQLPIASTRLGVGALLTLRGSASDTEDGVIPAGSLSWSSSLDGALGAGPTLQVSHLRPGTHELVLTARDRAGAEGRARVSVEVTNEAPAVTISDPSGDVTIKVTERLRLRGFAVDRDHRIGPERVAGSSLEWTSDKDGKLGVGEDLAIDSLSAGTHRIELLAKDEFGKVGRAGVRVTVRNEAPRVDIREPSDGRYFSASEEVRFDADARDPETPLDADDIVWRSNRDGTIGRGYAVRTDRLSVGEHEITCTATDRHGASGSDKVKVLITNQAPSARIVGPASGGTAHFSDVLALDGRGTDAEDGDLSGDRLVWTAVNVVTGRSHELGRGERLSPRVSQIVERLGFGRVELRLVATDRDGTASPAASIALLLQNRAPEVRIGNPTDGTTFTAGGTLLCSGYGQDPDRARLLESSEALWTARRTEDGATRELGRGTRLEVTDLAAGTWEITFTGIDPDDATLRTAVKVSVRVTPAAPVTMTGGTPTTTPTSTTTPTPTTPTTGLVGGIPGQ